jgi:hypothetical protein
MTTTAEVIALLNRLDAEMAQDDTDARIVAKGVEANQRRQSRTATINKLKADIKQAVQQL